MMKLSVVLIVLVFTAVVCAQDTLNPPSQPASSYAYQNHGSDWTGTCQTGKQQSPIDIPFNASKVYLHRSKGSQVALDFFYHAITSDTCNHNITMTNNGHTLEIDGDFGHVLFGCGSCDRPKYNAIGLVFHTPSEHTIDGRSFAMEMQIIHQKDGSTGTDGLLMVSVLFRNKTTPGENPFLLSLGFTNSPATTGKSNVLSACINLNLGLEYSLSGDYYSYQGSMSNPSCAEPVPWNILTNIQGMSGQEIQTISSIFQGGNNRAIQPLNGREVLNVVRHKETDHIDYN